MKDQHNKQAETNHSPNKCHVIKHAFLQASPETQQILSPTKDTDINLKNFIEKKKTARLS